MHHKKNRISIYSTISILAVIIINFALYHIRPDKFPPDDSYFYINIAYNIANGTGSTFNGIVETNGYHPFWMIFVTALAHANPFEKIFLLNLTGALYQIAILLSLLSIYFIHRILQIPNYFISSLLFIFIFLSNGITYNMESALSFLLVCVTLVYFFAHFVAPPTLSLSARIWQSLFLGALLGLTMLSRLDLVFFAGTVLAAYLIFAKADFGARLRSTVIAGMTATAIVVPYLGYNLLIFDAVLPISGQVKSSFPNPVFRLSNIYPYGIIIFVFGVMGMVLAFFDQGLRRVLWSVLSASTLFHVIYLLFFQDDMTWYYITGFLLLFLIISLFFKKLLINSCYFRAASIFVLAFLFVLNITINILKYETNFTLTTHLLQGAELSKTDLNPSRQLAQTIRNDVDGTRVLTWDIPGALAFFTDAHVFAADGLTMNIEYFTKMEQIGIRKFFRYYDINYILLPLPAEGQSHIFYNALQIFKKRNVYLLTLYSPLTGHRLGSIELAPESIVAKYDNPQPVGVSRGLRSVALFRIKSGDLVD